MQAAKPVFKIFNISIFALGLILIFADALFAYNLKEYFPLNEGDTWKYKTCENGKLLGKNEINKIKGTEVIGKNKTKRMISVKFDDQCIAIDSDGVKTYKDTERFDNDYEICNPPRMLFPNIRVGEKRVYPISSVVTDIEDLLDERTRAIGTITLTLVSVEDVEVPAGKFKDCLKFISVYKYEMAHEPSGGKYVLITWLAKGVGRVKADFTFSEYDHKTSKEAKDTFSLELVKFYTDTKK